MKEKCLDSEMALPSVSCIVSVVLLYSAVISQFCFCKTVFKTSYLISQFHIYPDVHLEGKQPLCVCAKSVILHFA